MRRVQACIFVLLLLASMPISALAAETDEIQQAWTSTGDYMASLGEPSVGSIGGEWMALGFARSGRTVPQSYMDSVKAYVQENIDKQERLHPSKATVNCRLIVALTALGEDVTNVAGHNLLDGLNDMGYIRKVGISGIIWTLIAYDCGGYSMPRGLDRNALIQQILNLQLSDGGWANSGKTSDPDVTAMAIQALAPYQNENADVRTALDLAIQLLSGLQDENGDFTSQYGSSSESISQVIVALSTLGIDANSDARFVKNGVSAIDGLLRYADENGGFRHILSGKVDGMATEQAYEALTAYLRFTEGKTALYDMSDVELPQSAEQPSQPIWQMLLCVAAVVILMVLFFLWRKRKIVH